MTSRTIKIKGGALIDTDSNYSGFVADDTSGLHFVSNPDVTNIQSCYSTLTRYVTETDNPLWNSVDYVLSDDLTYDASLLDGHVTLIGIDSNGLEHDIMQHQYSATEINTGVKKSFDLLQSACTGAATKQVTGGAGAGTVTVDIPKRYDKYESVTLTPAWMDTGWTKRKALQIAKVEGYTHGFVGHTDDYYGITVGIPYDADMNADLSDVRFCAPDGISIMPHYLIRNDAVKVAGSVGGAAVVLIPYHFIDMSRNFMPTKADTSVTYNYPDYIYMYYGNAAATSTSDITLDGNATLYDQFDQLSLGSQWTLSQTDPTKNTIAYATDGITLGATNTIAAPSSVVITAETGKLARTDSFEIIVKVVQNSALTTTEGFIMRTYGATSNNYFETRAYTGTPIDYGNGTSTRFAYSATFKATSGTTYTNYYQTAPAITSAAPVWFKFRFNCAAQVANGYVASYSSYNGYEWDYIGKMKTLSTAFTVDEALRFQIWYYGNTASPQAGTLKVESIITYPIMADEGACYEDSFQDTYFVNRYQTAFNDAARTLTETGGYFQLASTSAGETALETSYANSLALWVPTGSATAVDNLGAWGDRIQYGTENTSDTIYETEIQQFTDTVNTANAFVEGGIIYNAQTNSIGYAGGYGWCWGIRRTAGPTYRLMKTTWTSAGGGPTVSTSSTGIAWTQADLPIKLRVRINASTGKVVGEYKKCGTSDEWLEGFTDGGGMWASSYLGAGFGAVGIYLRGQKTTTAAQSARSIRYSYLRMDSGNGHILVDRPSEWRAEESYTAIDPTTPSEDSMTLTFDSSGIPQRNEPYTLTTKDYGGDYSKSKVFYLSETDAIAIGPDGVDKYIGMKLEFKFDFEYTDEFAISEINYIYEVM